MAVSIFIGVGAGALTYRYPMGEITPEQESYAQMKQSVVVKVGGNPFNSSRLSLG